MAAGKWKMYDSAKKKIGDGTMDLDTHTFKCALFLSTSNCDTLSNGTLASLTNQHANANGYTTGGVALGSVTLTTSTGTTTWDAADPSWTASGGSIVARFAVIYDDTAASDDLVCVCLLDTAPADVTATTGNNFVISLNASGILTLSGATSN